MGDFIMNKLSDVSIWKKILTGLSIVGTGAVTFIDPKIAGYVGVGCMALISPIGHGIAKVISNVTSNYAQTPSKIDDVVHAASEAVSEMGVAHPQSK